MPEVVQEKRVIFDGVTNIYTQFMETKETGVTPPTYETEVSEVPSLQDFDGTVELAEKQIHLSNVEHDNKTRVTAVTINLNAAYLGTDVAERAQGMVNEGDGAWSMPDNPQAEPFLLRLIQTDADDKEVIWIFPKCTLSPLNITGATRTTDTVEQIPTHAIRAVATNYVVTGERRKPYFKIDLTTEGAGDVWDRAKLLTQPIYDTETLNACRKTVTP